VEAMVAGVVTPQGGDVVDFVQAVPPLEEIFLIVVAKGVAREPDRPPFLVDDLDSGAAFGLTRAVRVEAMKYLPAQPGRGGESEFGVKVRQRRHAGVVEAVVGGEIERREVARAIGRVARLERVVERKAQGVERPEFVEEA